MRRVIKQRYGCLLLDELRNPSKNRILEPLRVRRVLKRSLPSGIIGSEVGLSGMSDSIGEAPFADTTILAGNLWPKRLLCAVPFLRTVISVK
jgi:hypothetical protein